MTKTEQQRVALWFLILLDAVVALVFLTVAVRCL